MKITPIVGNDTAIFPFNIGCLEKAVITKENQLFINGLEVTKWKLANNNYMKKENLVRQKMHMEIPFATGDILQPVLSASRSIADGRIFLRLYRNMAHYETKGTKAAWEGSFWNGQRTWPSSGWL